MPDELRGQRIAKRRELESRGVHCYGGRFDTTHSCAGAVAVLESLPSGEESSPVRVAGRLKAVRSHGKTVFADLVDFGGKIQLYLNRDRLGEERFSLVKLLDIGDIVGVAGPVFRTRTGEVSVRVEELVLLAKSLRPLPEKWHGLRDQETRYRQRYLDLIANEDVRRVFLLRSRAIAAMRNFLEGLGFVEVETPMLHPVPGGAAGRPFVTHMDALDLDLYLRIAPELYLKRLLVGGFERVYEINRSFRNEGISPRHNPEFTMLEAYCAYADYVEVMSITETLVAHVAQECLGTTRVRFQGREIDLSPPFARVRFADAIKEAHGVDVAEGSVEELEEGLIAAGVALERGKLSRTKLVNLLAESISAEQPTFVIDYPASLCPLARRKPDDPRFAERFELFIGGLEVGNAYSEQNDPLEQAERFREQAGEADEEESTLRTFDADFVRALEYGMPPAGGLGIGVDRLVMILSDSPSIRDVILFPLMRPETADDAA